jgi:hypothetical protein
MRIVFFLGCLLLAGLWSVSHNVGADAAPTLEERAQSLENALQAVEWYTNESVNKALHAEAAGDLHNAKLFGDKAIESDLKAQGLRNDAAAAWLAAGQPARARAAWRRAAEMAEARAKMLADRIPAQLQQWQIARNAHTPDVQAAEIHYLQSLLYTGEQWVLVVQFSNKAEENGQALNAKQALRQLLLPLSQDGRLDRLTKDAHFAGDEDKRQRWQALRTAVFN